MNRLVVARSDVTAALDACKLFLNTVDHIGHDLYYPLYAAIVICYGRPFTHNEGIGPLSGQWSKFSDSRLQSTHNDLIAARNEIIAHSDSNVRKVQIVPPGTTIGRTELRSGGGVGVQILTYYFPLEKFRDIHDTCFDLGRRLNTAINKEIERLYNGMDLPNAPFDLRFDEGL